MSNPAPGDLELVRRFVNTFDGEGPVEELDSPRALHDWLVANDLLQDSEEISEFDLGVTHALREALRAVMLSHHAGEELDAMVPLYLDDAACRVGLRVRFGPDGSPRVEAHTGGIDGALGRLLAIVHESIGDGTWERMKVCPADDCQVAFFDKSRNRSAVWCDMQVCGNRAKVRGYRTRQVKAARGGAAAGA